MTKQKQSKTIPLLLLGVVSAAGGFLLTRVVKQWMPDSITQLFTSTEQPWWETPLKLTLALVAIWAALAAHELGHLLMGLGQGFRFHLYVAGFLGIRRNPISDQVEWHFNRDPYLFGGVAATLPTEKSPNLVKKLAAVVAAGPLSSLGGALLMLIPIFVTIANPELLIQSVAARLLVVFLFVFGLSSLGLFLATTLPSRTGAFFTDRARFFRLIGGGKVAAVEQAVLELLAHSYTQQPYREMDPTQIALVQSDEAAMMKIFAHSLSYYYHLDRDEKELALSAAQSLDPLIEDQPTTFRITMQKDLVYAYAFLAQDAAKARKIWEQIGKLGQEGKDAQSWLAKAALGYAEGDKEAAELAIQAGLAALPKELVKYSDRFYQEQFEVLQATLR